MSLLKCIDSETLHFYNCLIKDNLIYLFIFEYNDNVKFTTNRLNYNNYLEFLITHTIILNNRYCFTHRLHMA